MQKSLYNKKSFVELKLVKCDNISYRGSNRSCDATVNRNSWFYTQSANRFPQKKPFGFVVPDIFCCLLNQLVCLPSNQQISACISMHSYATKSCQHTNCCIIQQQQLHLLAIKSGCCANGYNVNFVLTLLTTFKSNEEKFSQDFTRCNCERAEFSDYARVSLRNISNSKQKQHVSGLKFTSLSSILQILRAFVCLLQMQGFLRVT